MATSGSSEYPFEKPTVLQTAPVCGARNEGPSHAEASCKAPQHAELDNLYPYVPPRLLFILRAESAGRMWTKVNQSQFVRCILLLLAPL